MDDIYRTGPAKWDTDLKMFVCTWSDGSTTQHWDDPDDPDVFWNGF